MPFWTSSLVREGDDEALAHRLRIANQRFYRGIGTLAGFELGERGTVHAGEFGQVGEVRSLCFTSSLQLLE